MKQRGWMTITAAILAVVLVAACGTGPRPAEPATPTVPVGFPDNLPEVDPEDTREQLVAGTWRLLRYHHGDTTFAFREDAQLVIGNGRAAFTFGPPVTGLDAMTGAYRFFQDYSLHAYLVIETETPAGGEAGPSDQRYYVQWDYVQWDHAGADRDDDRLRMLFWEGGREGTLTHRMYLQRIR